MNEHNNECCVARTSLNTCIRMDTRDDPLVPAHGMLLSGSHSLAANMRGHYSHMVGSLQLENKIVAFFTFSQSSILAL